MRIDNIKHLFPNVPEKKVKIKIGKLDLSKDKEVRLFK